MSDNPTQNFGERFRAIRKKAGFPTQRSLSEASGVPSGQISIIEGRSYIPPIADRLFVLCRACETTIEELRDEAEAS